MGQFTSKDAVVVGEETREGTAQMESKGGGETRGGNKRQTGERYASPVRQAVL